MTSNSWCAQEDYDGVYAGTYSVDDNGAWIFKVNQHY
jgi:VCBS repeat-containing protein